MTATKPLDLQENIAEEENEYSGDEDPTSPNANNMGGNTRMARTAFDDKWGTAPRMSKRIAQQGRKVPVVDMNKNAASKPDVETQLRTLRAI